MNKYLKVILVPFLSIMFFSIILSIINLFGIKIPTLVYLLMTILIMSTTGFIFGLIIKDQGMQKGILAGLITSFIMMMISLILHAKLSIYMLIYYAIVTISITFGSIIGVNKKAE